MSTCVQLLLNRDRRRRLHGFTQADTVETVLKNAKKMGTGHREVADILSHLVERDMHARHSKGESLKSIADDYGVSFQAVWWRVCRWQEALYIKEHSDTPPPPSFLGPTENQIRRIKD